MRSIGNVSINFYGVCLSSKLLKGLQMRLPFQFNGLMLQKTLSQMTFFFFSPLWPNWPTTNSVSALHYLEERLNPILSGSSIHFYLITTQRKKIQSCEKTVLLNFVSLRDGLFLLQDNIMLALWIYSSLLKCILLYWVVLEGREVCV